MPSAALIGLLATLFLIAQTPQPPPSQPPAEPPPQETPAESPAKESPDAPPDSEFKAVPDERAANHVPSSAAEDRLWVASVPSGARVLIARSSSGRPDILVEEADDVGKTPLSLHLPAGDYTVIVQKKADEFEEGLVPAWRTVHDAPSMRSLLDNTDLSFDPNACCLPGSLGGEAEVKAVPPGDAGAILGDLFDGLPPFLFDGERLQILRVREARITHAIKMYTVRKHAGQSRLLVATFFHAEGDPLDQATNRSLPPGTPYDAYVDAPALEILRSPQGLADLAAGLKFEADHLQQAVAMLRRAGKAILHQQIEGGLRLVTLSVDDHGRLRADERIVHPLDLFAPPPDPEAEKKKRRKQPPPPPPPPPLPAARRTVQPGLGLPQLSIENTTQRPLVLMLGDGQLCWAPPGSQREFTVDPGTFEARLLGEMAPRGRLHFSYNARYALAF